MEKTHTPALDELLVLVELLETLNINEVEVLLLALVHVLLIGNDEDSDGLLGGVGKDNGASETFVTSGIVVLKTNLELNGLSEFALLGLLGVFQESINSLGEAILVKLAHSDW